MKKPIVLLVDADSIAYKAACAAEEVIDFGDDREVYVKADKKTIRDIIDQEFERITDLAKADEVVPALSHSVNWRLDILKSYKGNRANVRKPVGLVYAKTYIREDFGGLVKETLEGDDVVGILATERSDDARNERRVIYSVDKDLKGVPGLHLRGEDIKERDVEGADYFHLFQALVGDPTDGYKGCPGVGAVKAEQILGEPGAPLIDLWARVVEAYRAAELTEADALTQARVARICRWSDYDFTNRKVIPWNPPQAVKAAGENSRKKTGKKAAAK